MSVAVRVFGVRLHCRSLVCMSAVAAAAMALGACSADSSRFDAGFGLSQDSYSDGITTASLRPSEPVYGNGGSVASTGPKISSL